MFKRNRTENTGVTPLEIELEATEVPAPVPAPGEANGQQTVSTDASGATRNLSPSQHVSIISNDLTILGCDLKIISEGAIRVDGEIQGEIQGVDVTVGRRGKVVGTVSGTRVTIDGEVAGEIQADQVKLSTHARVDAEIQHQSLSIDQGARFDGSAKRKDYIVRPNPKPHAVQQLTPKPTRVPEQHRAPNQTEREFVRLEPGTNTKY